ncbi:thiol-disulfide isomerase/thioredoxin [Parabacteroides sp. PM6-13]|uniref:TlpA disulfide reductase family protein n=1 Tax=Parabacteroides sp. PM6-13 TaxID=1742408 RepID=UPI0024772404|nr:TlpA disulfide reductase family protein [Parabacteroides sp. PM6-13]MDH6341953.1 thiol-disulfide isomerase/thioredoxin [Parabacteroides sp. PM6-13]
MKKYSAFLCCFLMLAVCMSCGFENGFLLEGKLTDPLFDGKEVILITETGAPSDTVRVEKGKFTITGTVAYPVRAALQIEHLTIPFTLVNDRIDFSESVNTENEKAVAYKKSKAASNIAAYYEANKTLFYQKYMDLLSAEVEATTEEEKNKCNLQKDSLVEYYLSVLIDQYKKEKNREGFSIIVSDLSGLFGVRERPDLIGELFLLVPQQEKEGYMGEKIETYLARSEKIRIGQTVDFAFVDHKGVAGRVSDYAGKLVLVDFWATWCGPCLAQIPQLEDISARHADKIQFVMVSIDEDKDAWLKKAAEMNPLWRNIHYLQDVDLKKEYFVTGVPDNLLLSEDGKIMQRRIFTGDLLKILE